MKYTIKGKDKNTKEINNYGEFNDKEIAQLCFEKLNKMFSKGYDFWIECQPGTVKIIRNYKTK